MLPVKFSAVGRSWLRQTQADFKEFPANTQEHLPSLLTLLHSFHLATFCRGHAVLGPAPHAPAHSPVG